MTVHHEVLYLMDARIAGRTRPCVACGRAIGRFPVCYVDLDVLHQPGHHLLCAECACRDWYDYLLPYSVNILERLTLYCLLRADFFNDGVRVHRLY